MHLTGDIYIDALTFTRKVANVHDSGMSDADAAYTLEELVTLARQITQTP